MTALADRIVAAHLEQFESAEDSRDSAPAPTSNVVAPALPRGLVDRIRREFFAKGHQTAMRYGVTSADLLAHLERVRLATTTGPGRILSYIDDQIVAAACSRGHPQAWHDAWRKHENLLIRACRMRLDEGDAIVFTRRFWIDLHAASTTSAPSDVPSIAEYVAVRPLRIWLTDRLLGRLESQTRAAIALGFFAARPTRATSAASPRRGTRPRAASTSADAAHQPSRSGKDARVPFPNFGLAGEIRLRLVD
ncbi:MAG: hypothetical protein U0572_10390 [Phycisphaerales bacterium]